jgi:hypothetical protein
MNATANGGTTGGNVAEDEGQAGWWSSADHHSGGRIRPGIIGGASVIRFLVRDVWLFVYGVNQQRWNEQANVVTESIWR